MNHMKKINYYKTQLALSSIFALFEWILLIIMINSNNNSHFTIIPFSFAIIFSATSIYELIKIKNLTKI